MEVWMELASFQYSDMVLDKNSVVTLGSGPSIFTFIEYWHHKYCMISLSLYNPPPPSYSSKISSIENA